MVKIKSYRKVGKLRGNYILRVKNIKPVKLLRDSEKNRRLVGRLNICKY